MADFITILQHGSIPQTKTWRLGPKGKPEEKKKDIEPKTYLAARGDIDSLDELYAALETLSKNNSSIIRGGLVPGRGTRVDGEWIDGIRRTKNPKDGEPAYFRDAPHRWMMVDVDWEEGKFKADLSTPDTCKAVINHVLSRLPFVLRTAGCIWQFSAGAGFKPGIRAHLWFWLDRPMNSRELRRWAEQENEFAGEKLIDPALYNEVQLHYIADPVLEGVADPVAQRLGFFEGPPAVLPRITEKVTAYKRYLAELRGTRVEKIHDYIRNACASYFCAMGPEAKADEFFIELREAVDAAETTMDRAGEYPDSKLNAEIESGRSFARDKAVNAEDLIRDKNGDIRPTDSNARAILTSAPQWQGVLVYNQRTKKAEYLCPAPWHTDAFEPGPIKDTDGAHLGDWFHKNYQTSFSDNKCYTALESVAVHSPYDPIENYLNELPDTEETDVLDTWLQDWCHAGNREILSKLGAGAEAEYIRRVGRMTAISAVARALSEDEVKVDTVTVLEGPQGAYKSTLVRVLAGDEYYTAHNDASSNERDALAKFYGRAWLLEFKEMVSLGKGVAKVKSLLDASSDEYRKAFGRGEERYVRRCIGIATQNEDTYLTDETGNRRFWPVQVKDINIEKAAALRDRLWSQAVSAWRRGEVWWADVDDELFLHAQEGAFTQDAWEQIIEEGLESGGSDMYGTKTRTILPGAEFVTIPDVMFCLLKDPQQRKTDQMRVSAIMKRLGWTKCALNNVRGWKRPDGYVAKRVEKVQTRRAFKTMN